MVDEVLGRLHERLDKIQDMLTEILSDQKVCNSTQTALTLRIDTLEREVGRLSGTRHYLLGAIAVLVFLWGTGAKIVESYVKDMETQIKDLKFEISVVRAQADAKK